MIVLHYGSGARDFEILGDAMDAQEWAVLKSGAIGLLRARSNEAAAELLAGAPFELKIGTNVFGDDFTVLAATVPTSGYVELAKLENNTAGRTSIRSIVDVLNELGPYVRFVAVRLDSKGPPALVPPPLPRLTAAGVEQALRDAQHLLQTSGAVSAVDRVHTALHGYLKALCDEASIGYSSDAGITNLFKRLREQHKGFSVGAHAEHADRVARALATIVDSANTLRNRGSLAHPNPILLDEPEAILMLNCVRTLLHYVDAKTKTAG
jgi:hypothetical protein